MSTSYVSPTGVDAPGGGSRLNPFLTVNYALSQTAAPREIILMNGTYDSFTVVTAYAGTSTNPTVIRAENKWQAIVTSTAAHGIIIDEPDYITLQDIQCADCYYSGIKSYGNYTTISSCWVHGSAAQGIQAHNTIGTVVEDCIVEENGWIDPTYNHGIYTNGLRHQYINNTIRNNCGYGFSIFDSAKGSNGCLVLGNLVYGNRLKAIYINEPIAVDPDLSPDYPSYEPNIIVYNTCVDGLAGVSMWYAANTSGVSRTYNNILFGEGPNESLNSIFMPFETVLCTSGCYLTDYNLTEANPVVAYGYGFGAAFYGSNNVISTTSPFSNYIKTGTLDNAIHSVLRITHTNLYNEPGNPCTAATADIDDPATRMRFIITGGAKAGTYTFDFVTYPTVTSLANIINVSDIGFTALVTWGGSNASGFLYPEPIDDRNLTHLVYGLGMQREFHSYWSVVTDIGGIFTASDVGRIMYFVNTKRAYHIDVFVSEHQVKVTGNASAESGEFYILSTDFNLDTSGPAMFNGSIPSNNWSSTINAWYSGYTTGIGALPYTAPSPPAPDVRIRTYFTNYGNAAEIHIKAYKPFENLQSNILSLENNIQNIDGTKTNSIKSLTNKINSTFNQIVANYSQIRYLEDSFVDLQKYIQKEYGYDTIDEYLTDTQTKISPYCAKVFEQLGQNISDSNISD